MFIRNTKDILQVLMIIFADYLYRLLILAPATTLKNFTRHPLSMGVLFLCLFPFYLFFKTVLFFSAFFIKIHKQQEEIEEEEEELEKYTESCSICFDAKLDLCLDYCRDQFCLPCFQKYVSAVVKSSWGLCVTKIRCPVCRLHIPQAEWTRYVPRSIVELYDKFNRPYRSYSRCCPQCELEVIPCPFEPARYYASLSIHIGYMLAQVIHNHPLIRVFEKEEWNNSTLLELHHQLIQELLTVDPERAKDISKKMLWLDMVPDTWRKLQFDHIRFFPQVNCPSCQLLFCLQCGYEAHVNRTCEQNMNLLIELQKDHDQVLTWALENSQRCPSCSIMINRDEGCNKVDCAFCGFTFCWECKSAWSEKCGFFECVNSKRRTVGRQSTERTELGVPDISMISFT